MTNLKLDDPTNPDCPLQHARDLLAASQRVRRTDGISWLQRHLKIGHQQAIQLMNALVASGEMIRVTEGADFCYVKSGDGEVHRAGKVMVLADPAMSFPAMLRKWRPLLLGLGEVELEVDVMPLPTRSTMALSDALGGTEWAYIVFDAPNSEVAPL